MKMPAELVAVAEHQEFIRNAGSEVDCERFSYKPLSRYVLNTHLALSTADHIYPYSRHVYKIRYRVLDAFNGSYLLRVSLFTHGVSH